MCFKLLDPLAHDAARDRVEPRHRVIQAWHCLQPFSTQLHRCVSRAIENHLEQGPLHRQRLSDQQHVVVLLDVGPRNDEQLHRREMHGQVDERGRMKRVSGVSVHHVHAGLTRLLEGVMRACHDVDSEMLRRLFQPDRQHWTVSRAFQRIVGRRRLRRWAEDVRRDAEELRDERHTVGFGGAEDHERDVAFHLDAQVVRCDEDPEQIHHDPLVACVEKLEEVSGVE
mmetsp:Transcript_61051/g.143752  ORF Transcript_61051/g.143752 Transcript_61051/m.143752 type:complete len:226 (-) Transcript_61051:396-1073(-)